MTTDEKLAVIDEIVNRVKGIDMDVPELASLTEMALVTITMFPNEHGANAVRTVIELAYGLGYLAGQPHDAVSGAESFLANLWKGKKE
jgi:hypothetical protein